MAPRAMAKISTPAINIKMYRHFAVVTLVVTLLMAIFSSGENRQAIANQVAAQQEAAKARRDAMRAKYGTPKMVRAEPQQGGDYGNFYSGGGGGEYGAPTDAEGSTVQDVGSLGGASANCRNGVLVQQAVSDEDPSGTPASKCIRRNSSGASGTKKVTSAERQREIDALVKSTLSKAPANGSGS
jgi:hypothetical protein